MKRVYVLVLLVLGLWVMGVGSADAAVSGTSTCPKTNLMAQSMSKTCFECLFPFSMFGVTFTDRGEDSHAAAVGPGYAEYPDQLCGCICYEGVCIPGIPLGMWEPKNLVEIVREPFCFLSFDTGFGVPVTFYGKGVASTQQDDETQAAYVFYHSHFFVFPLWVVYGIILDAGCLNYGGLADEIDLAYLSEVDASWNDDPLSLTLFPEAVLFTNPIAYAACAVDAAVAAFTFPLDPLFWCAGSWGVHYPPTGNVTGIHGGQLKPAALVMSRLLTRLSRVGSEFWNSADGVLICTDFPTFNIVKSQYKFQLMYPIANWGDPCCQPLGRTMFRWGLAKTVPVVGDDFIFLLWKLQRCCLL